MLAIDDVSPGAGDVQQRRPRLEPILFPADVAVRPVEALKHVHLERDTLSVVVGTLDDLQATMDPVVTLADIHRALVAAPARVSAGARERGR